MNIIKPDGILRIYPNEFTERAKRFAISAHDEVNHKYDTYISYEFHLRMVVRNAEKYIYLIPDEHKDDVIGGCWCHDVPEDTHKNYKDVLKNTSYISAEIARACTNLGRGRTREERMPDWIYEDIRDTLYATYAKLCDRMANAQYSKMSGSDMFTKYQKEHAHFKQMLWVEGPYEIMWTDLEKIFFD